MARSDGSVLKRTLARDTFWVLLGQAGRAVLQAVYFVLVARSLGVEGFGAFTGVLAVVAAMAPFATLGMGHLLVRDVVRDPAAFTAAWGRALRITLTSGLLLLITTIGLARLILPSHIPTLLVLLLASSDVIFARLVDLSGQAYQGCHRVDRMVAVQWVLSGGRLIGLIATLLVIHTPTPTQWASVYLLATVLSALVAVVAASTELGAPKWRAPATMLNYRDGALFTVTVSAANIYNDLDKALLPRLSTLEASGLYGAAYKVLFLANLPLGALLTASYARFFKHGSEGIKGGLAFARRLAPGAFGYGALASIGLFLSAPLLPWVLGPSYAPAVDAVRLLSLVPLFKAAQILSANTLTGSNYQGARTWAQGGACVLNVGLNLWLIPLYSWRGAGYATLATEATLALCLWALIWHYGRRQAVEGPVVGPAVVDPGIAV